MESDYPLKVKQKLLFELLIFTHDFRFAEIKNFYENENTPSAFIISAKISITRWK